MLQDLLQQDQVHVFVNGKGCGRVGDVLTVCDSVAELGQRMSLQDNGINIQERDY